MKFKKNKPEENHNENINDEINDTQEQNNESVEELLHNQDDQNIETEMMVKLSEENLKLKEQVEDLNKRLAYRLAEFGNMKRRKDEELASALIYAGESVVKRLLPVLDDIERSVKHIEGAKEVDAIKNGINLIYEKLNKALESEGLKRIESIGQSFNHEFHSALMKKPQAGVPADVVIEEFAPGYTFKEKVIRHAQVIVSDEPETSPDDSNNNN